MRTFLTEKHRGRSGISCANTREEVHSYTALSNSANPFSLVIWRFGEMVSYRVHAPKFSVDFYYSHMINGDMGKVICYKCRKCEKQIYKYI